MGLFSKIKGMFDTGGVKVSLEAPGEFAWGDPAIPTRVTLRGHADEPRLIESLTFTFKDESDTGISRAPGMRDPMERTRPDGERVNMTWTAPLGLQLGPGETRQLDIPVPFSQGDGPGWLQSLQVNGARATFAQILWYRLDVHASIDQVSAAPGTHTRLKAVRR